MTAAVNYLAQEPNGETDPGGSKPAERLNAILMDDSAFDRKAVSRLARKSNFNIDFTETASIAETRTLLTAQNPDVVFLDYRVPDGDGIEFAQRIASGAFEIAPPVVVITGEGDEATAVRSFRSGAIDYLRKNDLTITAFDAAIANSISAPKHPYNAQLLEWSELNEELAALRQRARMNMTLAKSYMLQMAHSAWQSVRTMPEEQRMAETARMHRITKRLTGFLDETLILSETECREKPEATFSLHDVVEHAVSSDPVLSKCVRIGPAATFPELRGEWAQMLMLITELCRDALESIPSGTAALIWITCARDPQGNPILCVQDNGMTLEQRRANLSAMARETNGAQGPEASARAFALSLCQYLAQMQGAELRVRDAKPSGCVTMVRFKPKPV